MRIIQPFILVGIALLAATFIGPSACIAAPGPVQMSYIALPHADDEFQAWSLIEFSPDNYKVFVVMTRGEQTAYCDPAAYSISHQPWLGELPADPIPTGGGSQSCKQARNNALISFLTEMAKTDSTIPGSLVSLGTRGPFPAVGVVPCNTTGPLPCSDAHHRTAEVWTDARGWGAVVSFDLGNKNLTKEEVEWAIKTVRKNRATLGINTTLPDDTLIGTYANRNSKSSCYYYDHEDHIAVHEALFNVDFGFRYQAAATCKDDADQSRSDTVSHASTEAAFEVSGAAIRIGAHVKNYGWMHTEYYPVDRSAQAELFHTHQYFWIRFPH